MNDESLRAAAKTDSSDARRIVLHAGNGNAPHRLAASERITLEGPRLLDTDGSVLATYAGALWNTPEMATSWLRVHGDVALEFFCGDRQLLHQRSFTTLDLIGLTLWAPERVMLAYFSHWTNSWIDRSGVECHRIAFGAR